MSDNGNKEDIDIENTDELSDSISEEEMGKLLESSSIMGAFSSQPSHDNIKLLMTSGANFVDLLMRADIPSKRTNAALVSVWGKASRHKNERVKMELQLLVAGYIGINAKRANLIGDILGAQEHAKKERVPLTERLKKFAFNNSGE